MLWGWSKTRIDGKGRIFLGVRVKQELGDSAYVIFGSDSHVRLLSEENFNLLKGHIEEQIDLSKFSGFLKAMDPSTQRFLRSFYSLHTRVEIDEQGRITIPKFVRDQVFLDGELIVYSLGWCVEIWKAERAPKLEQDISVWEAFGDQREREKDH